MNNRILLFVCNRKVIYYYYITLPSITITIIITLGIFNLLLSLLQENRAITITYYYYAIPASSMACSDMATLDDYIKSLLPQPPYEDLVLTNGVLLSVYLNNKDISTTLSFLKEVQPDQVLSDDSVRQSISRIISKVNLYKKNLKRNAVKLYAYLSQNYVFPTPRRSPSGSADQTALESTSRAVKNLGSNECNACDALYSQVVNLTKELSMLQDVKAENVILKKKISSLCPKRVNQKIKRKNAFIKQQHMKLKSLKKEISKSNNVSVNLKLKLRITKLRKVVAKTKQPCRVRTHDSLQNKVKTLQSQVDDLQLELDKLNENNEGSQDKLKTKTGKTYIAQVRKCVYYALQHQVPVEHAGNLIKFISKELTGKDITDIPAPSTVSRMAREMGVISSLQTGELLTSTPNCNLAWDATDVSGSHINEVHVNAGGTQLSLGVAELPGGKSSDYHLHITETLEDAASVYADWSGHDKSEVLSSVYHNISSTMTDRVAVNHCVVQQLEKTFQKPLLELNCNVHPLDSVSSKVRTVLKAESSAKSNTFGSDCAAANVVMGVSKMRYKQGKGDPRGFKSFFKARGLPMKELPRYVGNRLHVLFHLAAVLFSRQADLVEYLSRYCSQTAGLRTALLSDIQCGDILQDLCILGLLGKFLTGPWMKLFYGEGKNLQMNANIKKSVDTLVVLCDQPELLQVSQTDVFGESLNEADQVLKSLQNFLLTPQKLQLISKVLTGVKSVLERQLSRYLVGDLSEPSDAMLVQASQAPLHNMAAERVMAMADAHFRRAPNALPSFVESKIKAKVNKSMTWLSSLPFNEQQRAVDFAVHKAGALSLVAKERAERDQQTYTVRLEDKVRRKDNSARKKLEKKIVALEKSVDVTYDDVVSVAPDASSDSLAIIFQLLNSPAEFVGRRIEHMWFDSETETLAKYQGVIVKVKKSKSCLVVGYWSSAEDAEDAEDFDIPRAQLISDLLYNDVKFCNSNTHFTQTEG